MDEEAMVQMLKAIIIQRLTGGVRKPRLSLVGGTDVVTENRQAVSASVKRQWPRPFDARRLASAS